MSIICFIKLNRMKYSRATCILVLLLLAGLCVSICCTVPFHRLPAKTLKPTICMTIKDKTKIPSYIYHQYERYAPEYELLVYDDNECVEFLRSRFGDRYARKFLSIREGAHRADFFRYAYLYEMGGVYLDVKTILIKPLREVFPRKDLCYTVLSMNAGTIYNGIISTPPRNPFISFLLDRILWNRSLDSGSNQYLMNTVQAFLALKELNGGVDPTPGFNSIEGAPDTILFVEKNVSNKESKRDRYGLNVFATDESGEAVLKIRDANYTQNYIQ